MAFNVNYDVPSTAETMGMFFIDIFLYFILAWYFDHIDSSNRGKSYGYFFFLDKNYWGCVKEKNMPNNSSKVLVRIDLLNEVVKQTETLLDKNRNDNNRSNINDSESVVSSNEFSEETNDLGFNFVLEEKLKILKAEQQNEKFEGLRILGCEKTYHISNKCCGTKPVNALKDVIIYF